MKTLSTLLTRLGFLSSGLTDSSVRELVSKSVSEALPKQLVGFKPETLAVIISNNTNLTIDQKIAILGILQPSSRRPSYLQ